MTLGIFRNLQAGIGKAAAAAPTIAVNYATDSATVTGDAKADTYIYLGCIRRQMLQQQVQHTDLQLQMVQP